MSFLGQGSSVCGWKESDGVGHERFWRLMPSGPVGGVRGPERVECLAGRARGGASGALRNFPLRAEREKNKVADVALDWSGDG